MAVGMRVLPPRSDEPWPAAATWRPLEALVVFVSGYAAGALARAAVSGPDVQAREAGPLIVESLWTIALLVWLRARHPRWLDAVGRPTRPWREVHEGAVFGLILYGVVGLGIAWPLGKLVGLLADEDLGSPVRNPLDRPAGRIAISVGFTLVVAPVAEELFFRGVLFRALRDRHGFLLAALGSAGMFALVHLVPGGGLENLVLVTATAGMGLGLALLYERRRNLLAPLAAHVAFNLLGLVVLLRA
jgi:membrane protease YdiL (CAAX protease family)